MYTSCCAPRCLLTSLDLSHTPTFRYNEEMSKLTKRYTNKLKRLYTHFVGYKVGTFYKRRYMYLDEFVAMLKKLAIIDQRFTKREARMAFWYMHPSPPC